MKFWRHAHVTFHDRTADMGYLAPLGRQAGSEAFDESRLATLVTRDCMIGNAVPRLTE